MSFNHNLNISYRRDIDGLRGIAIIAVVLYHAFPKYVKGGFIGVDVFFVISGYLISLILFKNIENNNFCLYTFYARRIKRIFPALLLVLGSSLLFGWFVLNSVEYINLANQAKSSTFFYTNFLLAKEAGYFDTSTHVKPLMHLWSLSIEEQFYIFWPLLLYFASKKNLNIITAIVLIILISYISGAKMLHKNIVYAFYLPQYRFWELASGSLLAYLSHDKLHLLMHYINLIIYEDPTKHSKCITREGISVAGLIMIISCIIFYNNTKAFPGARAILPVVGTIFLIAAGEKAWINAKILSNKYIVRVGLISYPLYLWHWSLISFAYILEGGMPSKKILLVILTISFILSEVTYQLFEKPIRSAKNVGFIISVLVILLGIVALFSYKITSNDGYHNRIANLSNYISKSPQNDQKFLSFTIDCASGKNTANKNISEPYCASSSVQPKFLIVGDSHTFSFFYGAYDELDSMLIQMSGHPAFLDYLSLSSIHNSKERMDSYYLFNGAINNFIDSYKTIKYVVLISRGPVYFSGHGFGIEEDDAGLGKWILKNINGESVISNQDAFVDGYVQRIESLIAKGKKVIFVIDFPELGIDPTSCLSRPIKLSNKEVASCVLDRSVVDLRQKEYKELVKKIQERVPSLMIYDPTSVFCDTDKCYGKKNNVIYYSDDDHLNVDGSKLMFQDFKRWFDETTKDAS